MVVDFDTISQAIREAGKRDHYRQHYSASDLRRLCALVLGHVLSASEARALGIVPRQTLDSALKRGGQVPDTLGSRSLMLHAESDRFVRHILACADANKPLTRDAAGVLAADLLALRGVKFGTGDGLPSRSWWDKMFEEYPGLSLRTPSPMSFKALTAISVDTADQFLALYSGAKLSMRVPDSHTINSDQTLCMVSSKERRLVRYGQRRARCENPERSHLSFQPFIAGDGQVLGCHVFIFKGKYAPYFTGVNQDSFDLPSKIKDKLHSSQQVCDWLV